MTNEHLSEEDLQLFAAGKLNLNTAMHQHLNSCAFCREELATYRVLYTEIRNEPAMVFDFDLQEAVLSRLKPVPAKTSGKNIYGLISAVLVAFVATTSLYKFRKNFINLSAGISFTFFMICIVACISIIGFKIAQEYHRYRLQIKQLNYSE